MTEEHKDVILVNEQDEVIGTIGLIKAIQENRLRRVSRVFVFDERGKLLIQRRSTTVFSPLLLSESVGGHVDEGESYIEAAKRELTEELGIDGELEEIVTSFRTKKFFNGIYKLTVPEGIFIPFNTEEVSEVLWFEIPELETLMEREPEQFTPSFLEAWPLLRDKIIP